MIQAPRSTLTDGLIPVDDLAPVLAAVGVHARLVAEEAFAAHLPASVLMDHRAALTARHVISLDLRASDRAVPTVLSSRSEDGAASLARAIHPLPQQTVMFGLRQHLKVLKSIVVTHAIDMMNVFRREQRPAKMMLHDHPVLQATLGHYVAISRSALSVCAKWHFSCPPFAASIPNMAGTLFLDDPDGTSYNRQLIDAGYARPYDGGKR